MHVPHDLRDVERGRARVRERLQSLSLQEQRECLMYSYLNLNLEPAIRKINDAAQLQGATLDANSPISDWFLFHNQSVTPYERQFALQRLAEHKGMDKGIYEAIRSLPTNSNRWAFEQAKTILSSTE